MIVVSDTTPLITLMKIGHLDLLEKAFGEIQIPEAVYTELTSNPRFQTEISQIQNCPFIHIQKISDERSVNLFRRVTGLDIGESEAIILSDDIHADLLLIDEVKGRQVAEQMGIKYTNESLLAKAIILSIPSYPSLLTTHVHPPVKIYSQGQKSEQHPFLLLDTNVDFWKDEASAASAPTSPEYQMIIGVQILYSDLFDYLEYYKPGSYLAGHVVLPA